MLISMQCHVVLQVPQVNLNGLWSVKKSKGTYAYLVYKVL